MNVQNKRVVVMGLGRFGGGLGVTKWLLDQGAQVTVTDLASEDALAAQLAKLGSHPKLSIFCGEHPRHLFEHADIIVANPAIPTPWTNTYLLDAWDAGITVTSEIGLLVEQLVQQKVQNIIGVTGSAGKSTTAAMINAALHSAGIQSYLGGNIGGSLLSKTTSMIQEDVVVLELSSAMLWWLGDEHGMKWSPHIAVLTNIEPNHIDWHGSFEAYAVCKRGIFKFQSANDVSITQDQSATFEGLRILGQHNQRNASLALSAAIAIGANETQARKGICAFEGLPHRLQRVGRSYYDDSKSTTPTTTKLAVDAFEDPAKIHLIVGGFDKSIDLSLLAAQASRVACMYTIGMTGNAIARLAQREVQSCETLENAVTLAKKNMQLGDMLLLSPGCASWDQFDNYEQRGKLFCSLVESTSSPLPIH